ncbi:hypothetical protein [Nocardioides sp.]
MEDTPILASVERDLELSYDELTTSLGAGPVPDQQARVDQSSAPSAP